MMMAEPKSLRLFERNCYHFDEAHIGCLCGRYATAEVPVVSIRRNQPASLIRCAEEQLNYDGDDDTISDVDFDKLVNDILESSDAFSGSHTPTGLRRVLEDYRPPSSTGSEDSGTGSGNGFEGEIDASDDDGCDDHDQTTGCCCGAGSEDRRPIGRASPVIGKRSTTPPSPSLRQHNLPCRDVSSECIFTIDLTGRTDVTFTIEPLAQPLPTAADFSSTESPEPAVSAVAGAECCEAESADVTADSCQEDHVHMSGKQGTGNDVSDDPVFGKPRRYSLQRRRVGVVVVPPMISPMMMRPLPGPGMFVVPLAMKYVILKSFGGHSPVPTLAVDGRGREPGRSQQVNSTVNSRKVGEVPREINNNYYHSTPSVDLNPPIKLRRWVSLDGSFNPACKVDLRVMTYNVLANKMASADRFYYCPPRLLSWSHRKERLLGEIVSRRSDVIALQEVEMREYVAFFQPKLEEYGYHGVFAPKSRARTKSSDERMDVDGCAIFYKTKKFVVVTSHVIEFNSLARRAVADGNFNENHEFCNRVLSRDNVGLALLLQTTAEAWSDGERPSVTSEPILVATVHLFWDPEYPDVKLVQAMLLARELESIALATPAHLLMTSGQEAGGITLPPLILAGDFNALPESGVVSFLKRGKIRSTHEDFGGRDYSSCLQALYKGCSPNRSTDTADDSIASTDRSYHHNLGLKLVDCHVSYTNYTSWFRGIIDHVLYSSESNLRPIRSLQGFSAAWLRTNRIIGFPTFNIPSDHVPLVVDFRLTPRATTNQASRTGSSIR